MGGSELLLGILFDVQSIYLFISSFDTSIHFHQACGCHRTMGEVLDREPDSHGQLLVRLFPEGPGYDAASMVMPPGKTRTTLFYILQCG